MHDISCPDLLKKFASRMQAGFTRLFGAAWQQAPLDRGEAVFIVSDSRKS